jgi:hypothetical protein
MSRCSHEDSPDRGAQDPQARWLALIRPIIGLPVDPQGNGPTVKLIGKEAKRHHQGSQSRVLPRMVVDADVKAAEILSGANFSHHRVVGSTGDCPGKLAHVREQFFRTKKSYLHCFCPKNGFAKIFERIFL